MTEIERLAIRCREREANEAKQAPLVNKFAAANGDYDPAGKFGVGRTVHLNRGGTAIDRWKRDGFLSDSQQAAVLHCQRLWELTDTSARLVANLDRTVFGAPGDGSVREVEARQDLHRIKSGFPFLYWNVFENVCRFDEPAGVAGSRIAGDIASAGARARTIVCMVADMISMRERLSY